MGITGIVFVVVVATLIIELGNAIDGKRTYASPVDLVTWIRKLWRARSSKRDREPR